MIKDIFIEAKQSTWKMIGLIIMGILTVISIIGFIQVGINVVSYGIK